MADADSKFLAWLIEQPDGAAYADELHEIPVRLEQLGYVSRFETAEGRARYRSTAEGLGVNSINSENADVRVATAQVLTEAFKGLLLVNGGGAVALLAFLQGTWIASPQLGRLVLVGIVILNMGLAIALLVPMLRYFHARAARKLSGSDRRTRWWYAYWVCMYLSVVCFSVAVGYLAIGGRDLIPAAAPTSSGSLRGFH